MCNNDTVVSTVVPMVDTLVDKDYNVIDRNSVFGVQTPQTFMFKNAFVMHEAAIKDGFKITGADGIWDTNCESIAKQAICKKQLVGYKYKNLTKIVQKAVGVEADGKFGKSTMSAVKSYQKKNKLTEDGTVGLNTWKKILGVK